MFYFAFCCVALLGLFGIKKKWAQRTVHSYQVWKFRAKRQPYPQHIEPSLTISSVDGYAVWEEPDRGKGMPLQIGKSGKRDSTVTGVWWLDENLFIAAHRNGCRIAIFDKRSMDEPIWKMPVDHLSDDIATKQTGPNRWEVLVSGCWACVYTKIELTRSNETGFSGTVIEVLEHEQRDFCHGVAYDPAGQQCYSIHTGLDPRIAIGSQVTRLPAPWGARDICFDAKRDRYLAVAVSSNPKRRSYSEVTGSLWTLAKGASEWSCLGVYPGVHSDALDVLGDEIWMPDQSKNSVLAVDASTGEMRTAYDGDAVDFPHGIAVSPVGDIALTNYGSSSVTVFKATG